LRELWAVIDLPALVVNGKPRRRRHGMELLALEPIQIIGWGHPDPHEIRECAQPIAKGPLRFRQRSVATRNRLEILGRAACYFKDVVGWRTKFESPALVVIDVMRGPP